MYIQKTLKFTKQAWGFMVNINGKNSDKFNLPKENLLGFLRDFYQCVLHVNYLWKLGNNGDLNILSLTSYYSTKQKPKTQLTNRTSHYSTILNNNKKPYLYAWLQDRLVFKISGSFSEFHWYFSVRFCSVKAE